MKFGKLCFFDKDIFCWHIKGGLNICYCFTFYHLLVETSILAFYYNVQYEKLRYTLKGDYLKEKGRHPELGGDPQLDLISLWYNRLVEYPKRSRRRL